MLMTVVFAAAVGGRFTFDIKIILSYVGGAYHILKNNIRKYVMLWFRNYTSDRSVGCVILHKQIKIYTACVIYLNLIATEEIIW